MTGFLRQVAERLYGEYGDDISSVRVLLPNRRAQLFFSDAISAIAERPIWQPDFVSVDDIMGELTDLAAGDHVRLMVELYKVYSEYHQETFDSFYFWGEMLLADFDSIDKYMVDAKMLFNNLGDLKELDNDHSYLTDDQREIISRFWKSFGLGNQSSDEKERFISIWRTLYDIYTEYRKRLKNSGIAYGGMLYRDIAEKIKKGEVTVDSSRHYVVAGFNALSECEKVLFDHLAREHKVDFFWDYDRYYTEDHEQEAGLFLRENIRRYPQKLDLPYDYRGFSGKKDITVVAAPSDSMQCKYVAEFLEQVALRLPAGQRPGKETAIVLTDENLLMPLLYSIPSSVEKINVTMGYPLRMTLAYSFVERLLELQNRKRTIRGELAFFHSDVTGMLSHPYVAGHIPEARALLSGVMEQQSIYVRAERLLVTEADGFAATKPTAEDGEKGERAAGIAGTVFASAGTGWQPRSEYLIRVISSVLQCENDKQQSEYLSVIVDNINKLSNSLDGCGVELTERIYASVLRKMLQNTSIPFEGEPLEGVQVMGILETRNLDFENVLLLSANDDTFPGNRTVSASFIPNNLRIAYGLPTPRHHEGVYAYYFYRLLQRVGNAHIAYNSSANNKSSGEQSRYIYQLRYESPHKLTERTIGLDVGVEEPKPITVVKDTGTEAKLVRFTDGKATLSPTSFYNFVSCPLKFYFHSIARIDAAAEISEDIDAPMFGSIMHDAMRRLYEPFVGIRDPRDGIRGLIGSRRVEEAVDNAIASEFFHGAQTDPKEYGGNLVMIRDIVGTYINTCILPYDAGQDMEFTIQGLEQKVESVFVLPDGRGVRFGGTADRVDMLGDGKQRVVDYKTGREQLAFSGIESLFSGMPNELNSGVLQTLLYSMMLSRTTGRDVQPALYYVRRMNAPDYSPLLNDKERKMPVFAYSEIAGVFEQQLRLMLEKLFDTNEPFVQCEDAKVCQWCDFNILCRRK